MLNHRLFPTVRILVLATLILGSCSLTVSPVRAQEPPPDIQFGAVEAFLDPVAAAEARVGWERILFFWSELQPNGPEEWNTYHVPEDWLAQADAAGRQVVGLVKHTPDWATDGPGGCGVPIGLDLPVDDPGNLWAAFIRRLVGAYAGRVDHWIIWNEPDIVPPTYGFEWCGTTEEYYQLLKVAYLAAHQANPDVVIHLAGLTFHHDPSYLRDFLAIATQDPTGAEHGYYFDVASLHIYFHTESVPDIINQARASMRAYGISKPIWINETNASPDADPLWPLTRPCWRVDLREQASFLLQSFSLGLANGVERIAVYKWMDAGLPPGGEPFGLIRPDYSRRPAYEAFRLITTHYAGTQSAQAVREPLFYQVTLNRGAQTTRVLWARTSATVTVTIPALAEEGLLVAQTGETQPVQPVDGHYTLTLPGARCPAESPECPVNHVPCIIGGPTYLLVEAGTGEPAPGQVMGPPPEPTSETEPEPTSSPSAPPPTTAPTAAPTATPSPTPTPTPSPTPTVTPILTSTPTTTPLPLPTAAPTLTPAPGPPPITNPISATRVLSLVSAILLGLIIGGTLLEIAFVQKGR